MSSVTPLPARRRTHPPRARVAQALEAERARVRAWLHDTLLQQLEYIAAGGYADDVDPRELMRVAAGAATELRAYIEGTPAGEDTLVERLRRIIEDEQALAPYEIRLVFGEVDGTVDGTALAGAVREALTNVRKHANAPRGRRLLPRHGGRRRGRRHRRRRRLRPRRTPWRIGLRESIIEPHGAHRRPRRDRSEPAPARGMSLTSTPRGHA